MGILKRQGESEKEKAERESETIEVTEIIDVRDYKQKRTPQLKWFDVSGNAGW
jgi:hypothetical protein